LSLPLKEKKIIQPIYYDLLRRIYEAAVTLAFIALFYRLNTFQPVL